MDDETMMVLAEDGDPIWYNEDMMDFLLETY